MIGIYAILNIMTEMYYVGSAKNLYKRWHTHKSTLIHNKHDNDYLQKAWNKYGGNNFIFVILENINDCNILVEREQFWIDLLCDGDRHYNLRKLANSNLGVKFRQETKDKISKSKLGKPMSDEHKLKLSVIHKRNANSPEAKLKFSLMSKNRVVIEEHKRKISETKTGVKHSEETKIKMKIAWEIRRNKKLNH